MSKTQKKTQGIQKYSKQLIIMAAVLVAIIGGSYAWLTISLTSTKTNTITAGTLAMTLDDAASEGISIDKAIPVSDSDGEATSPYSFTLNNTGDIKSTYTIYLEDATIEEGKTRIDDSAIRYSLSKNGETPTTGLLSDLESDSIGRKIDTGDINKDGSYSYTLKLWIDKNATNAIMGQVFSAKIRIEATQ